MASRSAELTQNWRLVLLSSLGVGLSIPTFGVFGWGLFMAQVSHAFGWSLAEVSLGVTVLTLTVALSAPLSGVILARFGDYRMVLVSMPLLALAMAAFALLDGSLFHFYLLCFAIALFGMGSSPILWTQLINARFQAARGLALGVASCGTAAFLLLIKPIAGLVIATWSWRAGFVFIAVAPLITVYPLALKLLRPVGSVPADGERLALLGAAQPGQSFVEAARTWPFAGMVLACCLIASLGGLTPHLETVLQRGGATPGAVVALASLLGAGLLIGRLIAGVLADRLWAPGLFAALLLCGAAGCLGLRLEAGAPVRLLSVLLIGLTAGGEFALLAYLTARYFGLRRYGVIFGVLWGVLLSLSGVWSLIIGIAVDRTGSYGAALAGCAACLCVAAGLLCSLGPVRDWPAAEREDLQYSPEAV